MQLLVLVLILVVPYVAVTLLGVFKPRLRLARGTRARIALSIFFAFTGIGHFIKTDALAAMLPAAFPARATIVYFTGVAEILAAFALWNPRRRKLVGLCIIVMLLAFLPANIYAAFQRVPFGGHEAGPVYLLARVPVQLLLIVWTYLATEQRWRRASR
jgi:uncharacterized membrane protein